MNNLFIKGIVILSVFLFLNGCWLNPYKENFRCTMGMKQGLCGSMNSNYMTINDRMKHISNADSNNTIVITDLGIRDDNSDYDRKLEALWIKQEENKNNIQKNTILLKDIIR